MHGLRDGKPNTHMRSRSSLKAGNMNLAGLRKSSAWAVDRPVERAEALSDRLEELLVFELRKDGGQGYLHLSVRGLYRHALAAITSRPSKGDAEDFRLMPTLPRQTSSVLVEGIMSSDFPLGHSPVNSTGRTKAVPEPPLTGGRARERAVSFEGNVGTPVSRRYASVRKLPDESGTGNAITYRERLGGYLHPRDMRRLVTPFSASNEPELIVRRHVILLNFDPLRAIILRDRLLVLVPDGADSLLVNLERRVRGGSTEVENSIFGNDSKPNSNADIGGTDHSSGSNSIPNGKDSHKMVNIVTKILRKGTSLLSSKTDTVDSNPLVTSLKNSVQSSEHSTEEGEGDDQFSEGNDDDDGEWEEMAGKEWIDLPFELQCVDAVLHVVSGILSEDTSELQDAALNYIQRLLTDNGGMGDDPLTMIRAIKDAIREMRSRVKGFVKSITRILDEDEDMALMNLSRLLTHPEKFIQPVPQQVLEEESDEPELILEAYLQITFTLENALDLIQGQIDTASELVDQKLDAVRNRILYANMVISVLSLCVASASLVGSIFGMNLTNGLETDRDAFKQVTATTISGSIVLGFLIIAVLVYSGTIPRTRFQAEV
jgi:hypothetical protein